ncbi:gamma-glutamylcyclotransferase family protein [Candidatus Halobonum tyrrellensis]|uniref:gamma-glutamylcyclotransferase family protein n=1 Tax=Candidatus Halobonum tyrrellensis TaxID=1431545 RepID=UPI000677C5E5|nr:gamma-glutamylcyclotransferase family protein [Candidatus Halobonum tyrrellensis]
MYAFVYGTLTEPERVRAVLDSFVFVGTATLEGLRVVEGEYPTLAPPAGADAGAGWDRGGGESGGGPPAVGGRLLRTEEVAALDAYEGVDDGLYVRVTLPYAGDADEPDEVATYVGDPERLGADARWPGDGPFAERVRAYLDGASVRVASGH